ncbi:hypothetical protein OROMI_015175 [Orobanche minor]
MSMVKPGNCWDTIPNGIPEDEEFDNILNILDFPMESLEDDGLVADWDISKSNCLGPIPSNVLMGPPTVCDSKSDMGPSHLSTGLVVPIAGAQDQKPPSNLVSASGSSHTLQSNKSTEAQESRLFQTPSPVSVLESSGSCSAGKNLPINTANTIPVRARSKRVKRSGPNPWLSASLYFTSIHSASKRASVPRKDKDKKRKLLDEVKKSSEVPNCLEPQIHRPPVTKKCTHCEVTKTPQWREGPLGPKTLCNACGVRYRSGRLFPEYRPAASPTFVPALHSNSHKKVIEMRNKGKQPFMEMEEEPLVSSPQPEFVPMSNYLFDYIY